MNREARAKVAVATGVLVGLALACGGGGGGGGGGSSSTVQGKRLQRIDGGSSPCAADLARLAPSRARRIRPTSACRIGADDVQVRATSARTSGVTDLTDDTGAFALVSAPTGNVTVVFSRDRCQGEVILPDVTNDSVLTM